jgi:ribose transport system permease protein
MMSAGEGVAPSETAGRAGVAPEPADDSGRSAREVRGDLINRYGLVGVFVLVILLFSLLRPETFPTASNAQTIASTQAVVALLALAAVLPLVVGQFDVSIGFQLGLSQTLCAGLIIKDGWPAGQAAVVAILACCLIGLVNGVLVTRLKLPSFIATLGVGTVVLGLTQLYGNDETISGPLPISFTDVGRNEVIGLPLPFVYVVIAAVVIWLAFEYTPWGRACHATGGSPRAALLAGIRTDRVSVQCFVGAGLLAGLSGVLSVTILGASAPTVGLGELLPAFAAAFLGATAIRPGRFNALGTLLAVYLLAAGITGLQMLGAEFYVQQLFNGGALLVALTLSSLAGNRARAA